MATVYMFPGQGSQAQKMGEDLFSEFPGYVDIARQIVGYDIVDLCLHNHENRLNQTAFTQPALYLVESLAFLKKIKEGHPFPDYLCGHSLGEYSALFASGMISFEDGIMLVRERGRLMGKIQGGAMAAVLGWREDKLQTLLNQHGQNQLVIANYNCPTQFVISGSMAAVKDMAVRLEEAGALVIPLKVSGAFHSFYMTEIKKEFSSILSQIAFKPARIPVISNVTARPYHENTDSQQLLTDQIDHPVKWQESINWLLTHNVTEFIECGPGHVLTGLYQKIIRELTHLQE